MKKTNNKFVIAGLGIIAVLLVIVLNLKIQNKEPDYENMSEDEIDIAIEEKVEDVRLKNLAKLEEGDRIQHYASDFMEKVDLGKFEEAYNLLYEEFKNNYFPTLASFEEYAKNKFPTTMTLEHTNIERNGDIYVIWTTMYDLMKGKDAGIEMNFVVQEKGLNDFVLSFSVI
ncbi:MAG: hypothetical protein IKL55_01085 [Clostridia bacterium]|nr:hypothetical protein [Clostridia bacterium]